MINLPIYYVEEKKTKADKTWLVGMNAYRNWHYHLSNKIKTHYHNLVAGSTLPDPIDKGFTLSITIYYKNPSCDGSNIAALMEKFTLDSLQELNIIKQDNVKHHLGTIWKIGGQDKENPRAEIEILPVKESDD